jgi:hypothetical protein
MEKKNKKILLITSAILLIGGGIGYWLWKRKKDLKATETTTETEKIADAVVNPKIENKLVKGVKSVGTKATYTKPKSIVAPLFSKGDSIIVRMPLVSAPAYLLKDDGNGNIYNTKNVGSINKATVYGVVTKSPSKMIVDAEIPSGNYGMTTRARVWVNTNDWRKA